MSTENLISEVVMARMLMPFSASAYALADRAIIPNVRYRRDIGAKLIAGDLAVVERLGHLAP